MGKNGQLFRVIKIRTMRPAQFVRAESSDPHDITTVTTSDNPRITKTGRFFRKSKIDELPQLINVLFGQMSFVGPRPDVPGFADMLEGENRIILSIAPGITGPASLKYRDEEELLAKSENPEAYNREVIFPDKVKINRIYIDEWSFWRDIGYIFKTVF